jgi:lysyl-tRNA synthetase class 2
MYKQNSLSSVRNLSIDDSVSTAGRIISFRRMGNVAFGHIQDATDKIQICIKKDQLTEQDYKQIVSNISIGCFVRIEGKLWHTSTNELTILSSFVEVVQTPVKSFPSSYYGIADEETQIRKRYLTTSIDLESANVFVMRSMIISKIRNYLTNCGFLEVETPIMTPQASGAIAKPFITHHNALDKDFYLRIAPETYLKMYTAGGFDKVFEIGKSFRNEGVDRSHIQEFTSLEWYNAYADYQDNKTIFLDLLNHLLLCNGGLVRDWAATKLDFSNIKTIKYRQLFSDYGLPNPDTLSANEVDELFKKSIRPNLIQPVIVEDYPAHMSPMAARKKDDHGTVEQWQFIVGGWEIVKCYTELTDSVLQRQLLEEQATQRTNGDDEAMMLDEAFLEAMEYGMPPQSGLGIGIDRLVCILANKTSLRDIVYFPIVA